MSARGTRATELLARSGTPHTLHEYVADELHGRERGRRPAYGEDAAAALGIDPRRIFKTLVASVDGGLVVAIVPVAAELDLKRLAAAAGGRRAELAAPELAERATGYVIGGISPLALRRRLPTFLDASAARHGSVFVSAGRRGLQAELGPGDLLRLTGARLADIER